MEFKKIGYWFCDIVKETFTDDLEKNRYTSFIMGIVLSSHHVYDGFTLLCNAKNVICSIQLIRAQVDICLLVYACIIMKNKQTFFDYYDRGMSINKLKFEGNPLTANFLLSKLEEKYHGITSIYKEGCQWIHPTNKRDKSFLIQGDDKNNFLYIGYKGKSYKFKDKQLSEEVYTDICNDMYYVNDILKELLNEVVKLRNEAIGNKKMIT
ncbi:hypothetical protein AAH080_16155 [Bacteroides thetaiotaomicron]|uniref:Uncharacterized protein n=1 Tax=Bacteroides thetaiotaomicron TaxID=818 RepID=A0A943HNJ2_BACT4|nr:hypothetical protein [Bacteroides thetaiotaomicron]